MKTQSYLFGILVMLFSLAAVGGAIYLALTAKKAPLPVINSFEDCMKTGLPVMETYPEQCKTPDGRTFTAPAQNPAALPPSSDATSTENTEATTASGTPAVTAPLSNTKVKSPLTVRGTVIGSWYFEASFPVVLEDAHGNILAQTPAKAQGDWMTTNEVPFEATLTWASTTATSGVLILKKDNPSGLPEHDKEVSIPVIF